jgi:hypothetical protein
VAHHQLRFDLLNSIHCDPNHDQQRRTSKVKLHLEALRNELRQRCVQAWANERQILDVESNHEKFRDDGNEFQV